MNSPSIISPSAPLVTVYIPCRNYGRYLEQAVNSVIAQLYPNWELFIIDEASEDNTASVAARLKSIEPDKIYIISHEQPRGLQKTANAVLNQARGRYIIRLDADDWLDEMALLLMVGKLESDLNLGIAYGNYFYVDENGRILGVERRHRLGLEDSSRQLPPHGACTMVRTRALKAVGGYSEDVDAQDGWELWYKLLNRVTAASLEAPIFYYRQHNVSLSRDSKRLLEARGRIFTKLRERLEGSYQPTCLAVFGVKESYPGFEGVPYQEIDGRSLLEVALSSATGAQGIAELAVSSTSQAVLDFSEKLEREGRVAPHIRILRPNTETSALPIREILLNAADAYHEKHDSYPDILAFLSIHAPLRRPDHVEKGLNVLRITCSDSVVSVTEEREPAFVHGADGLNLLNPGRLQDLTYDRERLYRFNGAFLATWWEVLNEGSIFGSKIGYFEMTAEESIQVKRPIDLARLEPGSST